VDIDSVAAPVLLSFLGTLRIRGGVLWQRLTRSINFTILTSTPCLRDASEDLKQPICDLPQVGFSRPTGNP